MEDSSKVKGYIPVIAIVLLVLIAFFAMDQVLYILGLVSPLLGAVILAYVLDVPVRFFENRCRFRRGYAVMTVILIFVLLVALLCYWAVPFLIDTIRDLYDSLVSIFNQGDMLMNWVQELSDYLHIDIESFAREHLLQFDQSAKELISNVFQKVYAFLVGTVTNIGSSLLFRYYYCDDCDLHAAGKGRPAKPDAAPCAGCGREKSGAGFSCFYTCE